MAQNLKEMSVLPCNSGKVELETSKQKPEQKKSELKICIDGSHAVEGITFVYQVIVIPMLGKKKME